MNNRQITVVCGRAGTGKTNFCIKEIVRELQEDKTRTKKFIFLVPEQFTVQAEKILLGEIKRSGGGGSIIRADVVNFKRMAQRAYRQYDPITADGPKITGDPDIMGNPDITDAPDITDDPNIIDSPGRKMILYKAIEECKGSLKLYKRALDHPGMINELLELISETGRYKFTKDKMENVMNELPDGLPLKQKLYELSLIIEKYEKILHKKYIDGKDLLDILTEKIQNYNIYDGARVWIDGFFGFTAQEYSIIKELSFKAEKVTVTLCCGDPRNRMYESSDFLNSVYKTYDSLIKMSGDNNINLQTKLLKTNLRHKNNNALEHLEREYENYPVQIFTKPAADNINIYAAKNIYSEVEYAACKITELCRDKGFRYRDIAVAAKNMDNYSYVCKDVFEQNKIPFFIDTKKDILKHPLARLIISALEIITENFSYRSVFAYLKTGLLKFDREITDIIENHVLSKNIISLKRWTGEKWWIFDGEELNSAINKERALILEPLIKLKERMSGNKNIKEQAENLYNFLLDIKIIETIESKEDEYIKIWNAILNVLDKMVEALGHEKASAVKFTNIFKTGLENYQVGEIPAALDCVQIGDLDRTKNADIKALFFMEVNEGAVPAGAGKEGMITDSERLLLKEYNINLAADSHEQAYLEEFQIYAALMAPSEYLFLSYVVKDPAGKAKRPSRIIGNIFKMFPDVNFDGDILRDEIFARPLSCLSSEEFAFSKYLYYLGVLSANGQSEKVWEEAGRYFSKNEKYKARIDRAKSYKDLRYENFRISAENAEKLFGANIITSVSRIEKYNSCPYLFFMEYGIKAKNRDMPDFLSREAGSFVHEILEKIGGNFEEAYIDEVVKDVLNKNSILSLKDSKRYYFLAKKTGEMVKRAAGIISGQIKNGEFRPLGFESECNMPIELSDASGKYARLTGKIDRIDTYSSGSDTYYRIIDYKTGNKVFDFGDFYSGTSLQLMTYLDSVIKSNKNAVPAGVFYLNLKDRFIKLDKDMTKEKIEEANRKKYKFNGIILADSDIARAMDKNMGTYSDIIQAGFKKDGSFTQKSRIATIEEFNKYFSFAENSARNAVNGYTTGKIAPKPIKRSDKKYTCEYCIYDTICGGSKKA